MGQSRCHVPGHLATSSAEASYYSFRAQDKFPKIHLEPSTSTSIFYRYFSRKRLPLYDLLAAASFHITVSIAEIHTPGVMGAPGLIISHLPAYLKMFLWRLPSSLLDYLLYLTNWFALFTLPSPPYLHYLLYLSMLFTLFAVYTIYTT